MVIRGNEFYLFSLIVTNLIGCGC